jgi:hypothetical protein
MRLRPSSLELLLVELLVARAMLPLQRPECAADRPLAGPVRRNGVGDRPPLRPVELSVGVQVLQPQPPQRLVSGSCPNGGLGVVRWFRAVGATGPQPLAGHALAGALELIGWLQLPAGAAQPDRRVSLHSHRNAAYRSVVTNRPERDAGLNIVGRRGPRWSYPSLVTLLQPAARPPMPGRLQPRSRAGRSPPARWPPPPAGATARRPSTDPSTRRSRPAAPGAAGPRRDALPPPGARDARAGA